MFHMLVQQPSDVLSNSRIFRVVLDISKKNVIMAPAVALGMGILYNLLPEMDTSSSHELCKWLGYHLNNTKLVWPYWNHWAADCIEGGSYMLYSCDICMYICII